MEWQDKLIEVYCIVCDMWDQGLSFSAERMSNNQALVLTDHDIISIYLFGIMEATPS